MIRKASLVTLLLIGSVLSGCGADTRGESPLPTPLLDPAALLSVAAQDPEAFAGQQLIVEGVLEAEGGMPSPTFYLSDGRGGKLATSAWAPLEVMQPPQGTAQPKSMAYYVGKRLRLMGVVTRAGEGFLLEVASAVEP